ncbi:MAG: isocitrate/isopropylmalate family dehydrogenase, partial [Clostridia bacterium]|nr:isocitrate/isopropylmalate family dehydrogenase [Clostridia bacterium]
KTLEYKQHNNLHSAITVFDEVTIVKDAFGGICFGERGFRNNENFGREAYDVEAYAELEIERTARTAYELADAKSTNICLVDKADTLASGKLWRKIVTDLNEDYPFVSVKTVIFDNAVKLVSNGELPAPIILTNNFFGSIIENLYNIPLSTAYIGDTTLALFELPDKLSPQQKTITINTLFELCFGI